MAVKGTPAGKIRIGVGGWTFEPWRGAFFPKGLPQTKELAYAGSQLTSIEINGTYYGSQKPASFIKWRDETPEDFVFAVKGPRFATNRRVLGEAGESIERFFKSGVTELKAKLGPVNWQFATTKRFETDDFAAFLKLLPKSVDGLTIRHAVEVRHESFKHPDFIALLREHGVAAVIAADSELSADRRRDRAVRLRAHHGDDRGRGARIFRRRARPMGGPRENLGRRRLAERSRDRRAAARRRTRGREMFLYVISGHKVRNPAAAMALIERISS